MSAKLIEDLIFLKVSIKNVKNYFLYRHTQESTGGCSPEREREMDN